MTRTILAVLITLWSCVPLVAQTHNTIAPGVSLSAAKSTLQKHGYEVGATKVQLAMAAPKGREQEFCRIDDNITLVIEYRSSTRKVVSLAAVIFPDRATSKDQQVFRNVLELGLYNDGIYTLKMKRAVQRTSQSRE